MANTISGKRNRDVRLDPEGRIATAGRLFLRGETVAVHRDCAAELLTVARRSRRPRRSDARDKQALPPATK